MLPKDGESKHLPFLELIQRVSQPQGPQHQHEAQDSRLAPIVHGGRAAIGLIAQRRTLHRHIQQDGGVIHERNMGLWGDVVVTPKN